MDIYDKQGRSINLVEYEELLKHDGYKVVDVTTINDVTISTVWLGINHNYGEGAPVIFETLVFGGTHDGSMERYNTEDEALEGHEAMVNFVLKPKSVENARCECGHWQLVHTMVDFAWVCMYAAACGCTDFKDGNHE